MLADAGAGSIAFGASGAALLVATGLDLFLTIFNYDGFTTGATLFQRATWNVIRTGSHLLPRRVRHAALSLASAGMLPATVALWLGLEITSFAFLYEPGLENGSFDLHGADASLGTAYYVSAGAISSLTFGDVVPRGGLDRALVDLETIVGLATFTLALGYVVTAFGLLGTLQSLHGRVRRHAGDPERPQSILARHFRGGQPSDLPSFLQALGDDLDGYDQGLRRYPVVYYFHTRRRRRSIPAVFAALGDLLALLRWGLPADEPMTQDPFLAALLDAYARSLDRLRLSFVGPEPLPEPVPVDRKSFDADPAPADVEAFRRLQRRARASAGLDRVDDADVAYRRYREWLPFAHHRRVVLGRVADELGYPRPRRPEEEPEVGLEPTAV